MLKKNEHALPPPFTVPLLPSLVVAPVHEVLVDPAVRLHAEQVVSEQVHHHLQAELAQLVLSVGLLVLPGGQDSSLPGHVI